MPSTNEPAVQRKLCRALACRKRIPDRHIFCAIHIALLQPSRYIAPVAANREPNANASDEAVRRIVSGTEAAIAYIARKEGRRGELARAQRAGTTVQDQGSGRHLAPTPYQNSFGPRDKTRKPSLQ